MMGRQLILYLITFFVSLTCSAQNYFFSSLSTREGLPSNIATAITQDHYGFIWIGTSAGLCRYDGYNFLTFKKEKGQNALISSEISSLFLDRDFLWVGTWKGLCRINTRTFEITQLVLPGNNAIRCLLKDKSGRLWVGTDVGLVCYSKQTFSRYTSENSNISNNTIRVIFEDTNGKLWIGTNDKLNLLIENKDSFESFDFPNSKTRIIYDIKQSNTSDSLWIASEGGLCFLDVTTKKYRYLNSKNTTLSSDVIKNIFIGDSGTLWLGSEFGLNVMDIKSEKCKIYFHQPGVSYSLASNEIWQIFEDRGGIIWICTSNGLSRIDKLNIRFSYREVSYTSHRQSLGNQVKGILTSKKGDIWLATIHGLICQDSDGNTKKVFDVNSPREERLLSNNIFSVAEDSLMRIWIGTSDGINVWDQQNRKMYAIKATRDNGLGGNFIAHISAAEDGSIWVSVWESGLFRVSNGINNLSSVKFDYAGSYSSEKFTYGKSEIWAIWNDSLLRIDPRSYKATKIRKVSELANGKDLFTMIYFRNTLWIGTINGLYEFIPGRDSVNFHPILTGDDVEFNNLIADESNYLWASTNKSIVRFSMSDHKVTKFPLQKELPFKAFFRNCSAHDVEGNIIFGGDNGYIRFSPRITPSTYNPPVYISKLEINGDRVFPGRAKEGHKSLSSEDISFADNVTLEYADRSIAASFSALHFGQPDINTYAYKLDGFDDDWKFVSGKANSVVYSNLFPGSYVLRVRGTNNYGIWSDHEATLSINVKPPLALSPLFVGIYILIFIIAIVVGLRIYTLRLKLKTDLKLALLEKKNTEEVMVTKQQFFTGVSHELKTPISMIVPPLRQVLKNSILDSDSRRLISLAEKNSQRLLRIVNQILDFRRLEQHKDTLHKTWFDLKTCCQDIYLLFSDRAARNNIDFYLSSNTEELHMLADAHKIETIIYNLLSNAFKFTPKNGRIELSIYKEKDDVRTVKISVKDTGVGIPLADHEKIFEPFFQSIEGQKVDGGSGIGLTLVKEYAQMHDGKVELFSEKNQGSNFIIYLPLIEPESAPLNGGFVLHHEHADENTLTNFDEDNVKQIHRSKKPLILLVDDNTEITEFIEIALKDKYDFVTAENGKLAIDQATKYVPEIIVTDVMMPEMNGITFCQLLKEDRKLRSIPIIMLTAKSFITDQIEGIRTGADIYLTKPFDIALLEVHIEKLLQRQTELAEYFRKELITTPPIESEHLNEDDLFLKKVMNVIESNVSNTEFSVEVLSDNLGMSSSHLARKLKSLTSLLPNEIIKKYRLKKASLLLKNKEGNITEIMDEVGFEHLSYFSKCFKAEFGISPKEYQVRESRSSTEQDLHRLPWTRDDHSIS